MVNAIENKTWRKVPQRGMDPACWCFQSRILFWFSVAGSGDRHCCDVTSRGPWEHQGQEEEEGGAGVVMGTQANMCILLEGRVSRRGIWSP